MQSAQTIKTIKTTVKVTTETGDMWTATINLPEQDAIAYYQGKVFNVGLGPEDRMERVVKVEVIK